MKVLGLDYGRVRIGLAIAEGPLAMPLKTVLYFGDRNKIIQTLRQIVNEEQVERIVVGISEGIMAKESEQLADLLAKELDLPVSRIDETLTTVEAKRRLLEGGAGAMKRGKTIDAAAAAVILQYWLDQDR